MSGHLSTEEKALFKAEIDAIRRKDYAFHRVLEANKIKFKRTGEPLLDGMVVYEDLKFLGSPKTYQYNLETLKEK
jgi:hypothetical protein